MDFYEYLAPEFEVIGISPGIDCIEYPGGGAWGDSGLLISTRDYAKIALLCQRMGNWNGKQLISEEYMRAATSKQIDNSHESYAGRAFRERSGYGYQFWVIAAPPAPVQHSAPALLIPLFSFCFLPFF